MAKIKVKPGWEDKEYTGRIGTKRVKRAKLGSLSEEDLQTILDTDPRNASRMIDGTPSKLQAKTDNNPGEPRMWFTSAGKTDNNPGEPLPAKPKA